VSGVNDNLEAFERADVLWASSMLAPTGVECLFCFRNFGVESRASLSISYPTTSCL
jgi:hypothetical protein